MTTSALRLSLVIGLGLATVVVAARPILADYYDNNFNAQCRAWMGPHRRSRAYRRGPINSCENNEEVDVTGTATVTTKTLMDAGNLHTSSSRSKSRLLGLAW
jgi:hypothetical protein